MKTQRRLATWTFSVGCMALLGACGAEQPAPQCTVGRGDHAVRYVLKTGSGTCAEKKAEIVGAQAFRIPNSGTPPTVYFNAASLVTGTPSAPVAVSASGPFTSEYPSDDNVCTVQAMSEARQGVGDMERVYRWSNVRVQSRAAIPGTQWVADLIYSEGNCTASYEAVGVFPAIRCVRTVDNQEVRDESLCGAVRQGSTLDPAFPIYCEETTNLCVLNGLPPALK
ncbi:hypothetical protein [Cystobacter ferrugineus]|uniref:MlpA n=1 Tax=Cystobacter ferrugineus TaxID=83449 RepID=A0A1L9BGJ8_9BACT|nr:hypothetical protein [Cystobacter ferrugineus]OJH41369.1 hypothetical protein BON30_10930 [Cystobacter ferrugineus]